MWTERCLGGASRHPLAALRLQSGETWEPASVVNAPEIPPLRWKASFGSSRHRPLRPHPASPQALPHENVGPRESPGHCRPLSCPSHNGLDRPGCDQGEQHADGQWPEAAVHVDLDLNFRYRRTRSVTWIYFQASESPKRSSDRARRQV